jgi:hypothetical protein
MTAEQYERYTASWSTLTPEEYQQLDRYEHEPRQPWRPSHLGTSSSSTAPPRVENPVDHFEEEAVIHQLTPSKVEDRNTLLIDIGSPINVIGSETLQQFKEVAERNGKSVTITKRKKPMRVSGVGGSSPCYTTAKIPLAVRYRGHDHPDNVDYKSCVVEGKGAHLPAILGSTSMANANTVIIMNKGKEYMALPGEGGYAINWSPGTRIMPMHKTESGHYVVICDEYTTLNTESNRVFVTGRPEPANVPEVDEDKTPPLCDSSCDEMHHPLYHEEDYTDVEEDRLVLQ